MNQNLEILNSRNESTFTSHREGIDHILAMSEIPSLIKKWHEYSLNNSSDHRAICYQMVLKTNWGLSIRRATGTM